MEDIDEANESIAQALQTKKEGELSEEELENVAGGLVLSAVITSATVVFSNFGTAVISGVKSAIASFMSGR